jgi:hypothetical protein
LNINIDIAQQMKYLAAYTLLALSGKKDISISPLTQPPTTSRTSSPPPMSPSMTRKLPPSSTRSREKPSINSLPRAAPSLELDPPLRPPRLLSRRSPRKRKSPRRRRNRKRKKNLSLWRRMKILEDCSIDTRPEMKNNQSKVNL